MGQEFFDVGPENQTSKKFQILPMRAPIVTPSEMDKVELRKESKRQSIEESKTYKRRVVSSTPRFLRSSMQRNTPLIGAEMVGMWAIYNKGP